MKRLRILTGHHAGASIDLAPGEVTLGADGARDITLIDWTFAPLVFRVRDGSVSISWMALGDGKTAGTEQSRPMLDFEPREFDGTVICVGPADAAWPADVQLLGSVFEPTPQRIARWAGAKLRVRRVALWSGSAGVVLAAVLSAVYLSAGAKPPAAVKPSVAQVQASLEKAIAAVAPDKLEVRIEQQSLVVDGMLDSAEQGDSVRQAIESVRSGVEVQSRYSLATDIAETIRNAVGLPDATVKYLGHGNFSYAAEAADPRATRAAIDRVSADLAPAVHHIEATLEAGEPGMDARVLSTLRSDTIEVVQTRDGVKHLVVHPAPSVDFAAALSLTETAEAQTLADAIPLRSTRAPKRATSKD